MINVHGSLVPTHLATIKKHVSDYERLLPTEDYDWDIFMFPGPGCAREVKRANAKGVKTAAYWIGNDVIRYRADEETRKNFPEFDLHIACHDRLRDDLSKVGIKAELVYFPATKLLDLAPVPRKKCVSLYMPSYKPAGKYNFEHSMDIARMCKGLSFKMYGSNMLPMNSLPPNVQHLGLLTPSGVVEVLRTCSCMLRITNHDGLPQGIIEAKMLGRQVMTTFPYHGCYQIIDPFQAPVLLEDRFHVLDDESFNWYVDNCSPENFVKSLAMTLWGANENLPCKP